MEVILPKSGKYVAAVSGGVDSVSLLHMLKDLPGLEVTVAHFDHGIRPDSSVDREFVRKLAEKYELSFIYEEGRLGPAASEAEAREARYKFLRRVLADTDSRAIITAHHRDDVLETAIINLLRGSGRKGLTALASRKGLERPLLDMPKSDIINYARRHKLAWREDATNLDTDYLRNYVRHRVLPRFDEKDRQQLLGIIAGLRTTNTELDGLLAKSVERQLGGRLDRDWFAALPHDVAKETMAAWLRGHELRDFDKRTLERLVIASKTALPGKTFNVRRGVSLKVDAHMLALTGRER